jgi:hypothetical protein
MEKITLSTQLVNAVLGYLGARPYQEVFQLIEGLQNEAKNQVQPTVEEPKE